MKTISIVKWNLAEIFRITESTGNSSYIMYPAENPTITYKGSEYSVKLAKMEYIAKEQTLYLIWVVI